MPGHPTLLALSADGTRQHQILHTFTVGGTPQFIVTGLYPPTSDPVPRQAASGFVIPMAVIVLLIIGLLVLCISAWLILRRYVGTDLSRPRANRTPNRTR